MNPLILLATICGITIIGSFAIVARTAQQECTQAIQTAIEARDTEWNMAIKNQNISL